jgi:hypothetical protein
MRVAGIGCAGRLCNNVLAHSTVCLFHPRGHRALHQGCSPCTVTKCESAREGRGSGQVEEDKGTPDHLSNGALHDSATASLAAAPEIAEPGNAECACAPLGQQCHRPVGLAVHLSQAHALVASHASACMRRPDDTWRWVDSLDARRIYGAFFGLLLLGELPLLRVLSHAQSAVNHAWHQGHRAFGCCLMLNPLSIMPGIKAPGPYSACRVRVALHRSLWRPD